jgi:hypothetical protein
MVATTAALPCDPWPAVLCCDFNTAPAATGWALEAATEVLWSLSGRRFGTCQVTSRPCKRECASAFPLIGHWWEWGSVNLYPQPALIGGSWFNIVCGRCGTGCSCSSVEEVVLPAPVAEIIEITVDGVAIPTGSYRVDDGRLLVRQDGGVWPTCQDLSVPATGVGAWTVTATYGEPVPMIGQLAVGELACELVKACDTDLAGDCRLPPNLQSLVREGVSIQFTEDVQSRLRSDGRIGLWSVDIFLVSFNPRGLPSRSQVYSPDVPRPRVSG